MHGWHLGADWYSSREDLDQAIKESEDQIPTYLQEILDDLKDEELVRELLLAVMNLLDNSPANGICGLGPHQCTDEDATKQSGGI